MISGARKIPESQENAEVESEQDQKKDLKKEIKNTIKLPETLFQGMPPEMRFFVLKKEKESASG